MKGGVGSGSGPAETRPAGAGPQRLGPGGIEAPRPGGRGLFRWRGSRRSGDPSGSEATEPKLRREALRYLVLRAFAPVILAIAGGLLLAGVAARLLGADPAEFFALLYQGTLGSAYGFSQVLFKATPLIFTGLAVALAFQARLFNIGAEGQMVIGGFAMAWIGFSGPAFPAPLGALVALAAGAAGGALWGLLPGAMKARTGGSEVIVTILLNFIALALVNYLLVSHYALSETVRTAEVHPGAWLPRFSESMPALKGSPLSVALLVAIAAAVVVHLVLSHTPFGFSLRVLGEGGMQARYAGLSISRLTMAAMALSGALAGLAGSGFVLGYKHYYEGDFSAGAGFTGIAVALLARSQPLAVVPSAIFYGLLSYGGLVVNPLVTRELLDVIQALILLLFIVFDRAFSRPPRPRRRRPPLGAEPAAEAT